MTDQYKNEFIANCIAFDNYQKEFDQLNDRFNFYHNKLYPIAVKLHSSKLKQSIIDAMKFCNEECKRLNTIMTNLNARNKELLIEEGLLNGTEEKA